SCGDQPPQLNLCQVRLPNGLCTLPASIVISVQCGSFWSLSTDFSDDSGGRICPESINLNRAQSPLKSVCGRLPPRSSKVTTAVPGLVPGHFTATARGASNRYVRRCPSSSSSTLLATWYSVLKVIVKLNSGVCEPFLKN